MRKTAGQLRNDNPYTVRKIDYLRKELPFNMDTEFLLTILYFHKRGKEAVKSQKTRNIATVYISV